MEDNEIKIEIKPYTLKQLAERYKMPLRIFREWVADVPDLGRRIGHYYTPLQVQKIVTHVGRTCASVFAFFVGGLVNTSDAFGRTFISEYDRPGDLNQSLNSEHTLETDADDFTDSSTSLHPVGILAALMVFISMPIALYKLIRLSQQPLRREEFLANGSAACRWDAPLYRRALLATSYVLVIVSGCLTVGFAGYWMGMVIF